MRCLDEAVAVQIQDGPILGCGLQDCSNWGRSMGVLTGTREGRSHGTYLHVPTFQARPDSLRFSGSFLNCRSHSVQTTSGAHPDVSVDLLCFSSSLCLPFCCCFCSGNLISGCTTANYLDRYCHSSHVVPTKQPATNTGCANTFCSVLQLNAFDVSE